ncbi:hypothetical protein GPECTOR_15g375 [Gonium pectorale]|uniref:Uncharacterized protein n=1 Tax=Gonium pectorale TaxID=33097 RepID=A0A150GLM0_GONPE|nr:hypothetical protein GPECTOR_15g375 [Gonium pectorale]|eukprot:KXZ50691.1 hypothetical protein GPECTOR_15g375 [Gonium pectorale]
MARAKFVAGLVLGLVLAASLATLHSRFPAILHRLHWHSKGCSYGSAQHEAYRKDVKLLSHLSPGLVTLTDAHESAAEVLQKLDSYDALVVITAGRGAPVRRARRADNQPFISIADGCSTPALLAAAAPADCAGTAAAAGSGGGEGGGALAALAAPLRLMNAAAEGVEAVLGRRLFPTTISTFDRAAAGAAGAKGPFAIWDASAGLLLLDRQFASATWSYDRPEVSYITAQLGSRLFGQMAAMLRAATGTGTAAGGADESARSGAAAAAAGGDGSGGGDAADAKAAGAAVGLPTLLSGLLLRGGQVATGFEGLAGVDLDSAAADGQLEEPQRQAGAAAAQQRKQLKEQLTEGIVAADAADATEPAFSLPHLLSQLPTLTSASASADAPGAAGAAASPAAAAAALGLAAAALSTALSAAFAAAPPLWFCILCPTVLGLTAPILINLTLNQLAGALCSQMHLTDDACFDVLLGALGAGFVLSLASAVPIFFACRLPDCAGRNVTAALRALRW